MYVVAIAYSEIYADQHHCLNGNELPLTIEVTTEIGIIYNKLNFRDIDLTKKGCRD